MITSRNWTWLVGWVLKMFHENKLLFSDSIKGRRIVGDVTMVKMVRMEDVNDVGSDGEGGDADDEEDEDVVMDVGGEAVLDDEDVEEDEELLPLLELLCGNGEYTEELELEDEPELDPLKTTV